MSMTTTDCNHKAMKKIILDNLRISLSNFDDVGISFGLCQAIFTDALGMKRVVVKIVPKLLYGIQRPFKFAQ